MITEKVAEALITQIGEEAFASQAYLAMASWCQKQGFRGSAGFFYVQADEERTHMLKIVRFINDSGGHARIPAVREPRNDFGSLRETFESALQQEQAVTRMFSDMADLSLEAKDHAAYQFLQWFIAEQVEEESLFQGVLDVFRLAGEDDRSLFLIDKEVSRMRSEAAGSTPAS